MQRGRGSQESIAPALIHSRFGGVGLFLHLETSNLFTSGSVQNTRSLSTRSLGVEFKHSNTKQDISCLQRRLSCHHQCRLPLLTSTLLVGCSTTTGTCRPCSRGQRHLNGRGIHGPSWDAEERLFVHRDAFRLPDDSVHLVAACKADLIEQHKAQGHQR